MTALTTERATRSQDVNFQHFYEPLVLEDTVKAWKGGLAGLYISGATVGEVAPFKTSADMIGLGKFTETVDNALDGEFATIEGGVFIWTNGAAGDALAIDDIGKFAFGLDDQVVGVLPWVTGTPIINTITPAAANDTKFSMALDYKLPGESFWKSVILAALGDAGATATEIADDLRAHLVTKTELAGFITGTGTATLILTGAEGVDFRSSDIGTGVLAVVVTESGTLNVRSKAGVVMDLTVRGPAILSHPSVYAGLIV